MLVTVAVRRMRRALLRSWMNWESLLTMKRSFVMTASCSTRKYDGMIPIVTVLNKLTGKFNHTVWLIYPRHNTLISKSVNICRSYAQKYFGVYSVLYALQCKITADLFKTKINTNMILFSYLFTLSNFIYCHQSQYFIFMTDSDWNAANSVISRAHSFPRKIFVKFSGPARKIPRLTAATLSKFRGSPRPPIYDWKLFRNISYWRLALY